MTYSVKEAYYTLQGEGAQTGRAAVFLRFAGCNLWSGLERDRAGAVCCFCDTDFVGVDGPGGGKFASADELAGHVAGLWPGDGGAPYVVCTGGEPLLQVDEPLIAALHARGFEVGVETNGTIAAPASLDWVCVSPKSTAELQQMSGDELKLVYPQKDAPPEKFAGLHFRNFFLQPMDGPRRLASQDACIAYCLKHPQWRLSLQTHKLTGMP
jgi:7-carboxy-7-deazaguanine synthase (Cx14CxxC type)